MCTCYSVLNTCCENCKQEFTIPPLSQIIAAHISGLSLNIERRNEILCVFLGELRSRIRSEPLSNFD